MFSLFFCFSPSFHLYRCAKNSTSSSLSVPPSSSQPPLVRPFFPLCSIPIAHPPHSHPCHPYPCHLRQEPQHPRPHVCPLRYPNSRYRRLLCLLSLSVFFFPFFLVFVSKQPSPAVPLLSGQGCIAGPRHAWVGIYWIAPTLLYTVSVSFLSSLMLHSLILPSSLWLSCAPSIPSKPAP
jgi:hypothetical protein